MKLGGIRREGPKSERRWPCRAKRRLNQGPNLVGGAFCRGLLLGGNPIRPPTARAPEAESKASTVLARCLSAMKRPLAKTCSAPRATSVGGEGVPSGRAHQKSLAPPPPGDLQRFLLSRDSLLSPHPQHCLRQRPSQATCVRRGCAEARTNQKSGPIWTVDGQSYATRCPLG